MKSFHFFLKSFHFFLPRAFKSIITDLKISFSKVTLLIEKDELEKGELEKDELEEKEDEE